MNASIMNFREVKKRTGDWFYDQRVNRFSMNPGHDLVRASLKKRPAGSYKNRKDVLSSKVVAASNFNCLFFTYSQKA